MPKFYPCLLCSKRTSQQDRYRIKKEHADFIKRRLRMDVSDDSMLCRKCRHMCETKSTRDSICNSPEPNKIQKTLSKQSIKSPPSVTLSIPSTSTSHANCVICKKPGPKLVVVPENTRVNVFIQKETFVPPGSRCCPKHISDGDLNTEALHLLKQTSSVSNVNRTTIVGVLKQTRDVAIQNQNKRLNFDDPHGMQNEDLMNKSVNKTCMVGEFF